MLSGFPPGSGWLGELSRHRWVRRARNAKCRGSISNQDNGGWRRKRGWVEGLDGGSRGVGQWGGYAGSRSGVESEGAGGECRRDPGCSGAVLRDIVALVVWCQQVTGKSCYPVVVGFM